MLTHKSVKNLKVECLLGGAKKEEGVTQCAEEYQRRASSQNGE